MFAAKPAVLLGGDQHVDPLERSAAPPRARARWQSSATITRAIPGRTVLAMLRTSVCNALGVAIAGDDDVHRPAVLAIPLDRASHFLVARVRAQPHAPLQRGEAQRKRDQPEQDRAQAEIA